MAVKVGLDIEFSFEHNGNQIPASNYLRFSDRFGTDGCSSIVEIRPFPSEDPRYVINSLSRIMKMKIKRQPELLRFEWIAGSIAGGKSIGGHIHFGSGRMPSGREVAYLDTFLATTVALTDDRDNLKSRQSAGYGMLGSYRQQPWGWEYRTLPSFITDKKFAEGVLILAQMIVDHCMEAPATNEERTALQTVVLLEKEKLDYRMGELTLIKTKFMERVTFLKTFIKGVSDSREIGYMFRCVHRANVDGSFTIANKDFKQSWGIKKLAIMKYTLQEIWEMVVR